MAKKQVTYGKASVGLDENNNRVITQPFQIECDNEDGPETAITYLDVQFGDHYKQHPDGESPDFGEENEGAFVTGANIDPDADAGWYSGTITYTTKNEGFSYQVESLADWDKPSEPKNNQTQPEDRSPTITRTVEYVDVAWTHDLDNGAPLLNSSKQPYIGETRRIKIDVYTLTWFKETNYYFDHYREFENCINADAWNGFLVHGLLFDSFTYQSQHNNGKFVWACSAVFKENRNWEFINSEWIIPGWKVWLVDKGTRYNSFVSGYKPIKNQFGELEEKLLQGAGSVLGEGLNPVFLGYHKYRRRNFSEIFA